MKISTALTLLEHEHSTLLWRMSSLFTPFYRVCFLSSASASGLLQRLGEGPIPFSRLADTLAPEPRTHGMLEAWLDLGVRLGELGKSSDGYWLKGYLARRLSRLDSGAIPALLEEVATFHHRLILEVPSRLRRGEPWTPAEHDAGLIARSSRILEPFVFEFMDRTMPPSGPVKLLEVGCGAGTYLRTAAEKNPDLSAVGCELRAEVAEEARRAIERWGLASRVSVVTGDVRALAGDGTFDVVTLYNLIYYFTPEERPQLFRALAGFLKPAGKLLVSTCCRGGSPGMHVLHLWTSGTAGFGPLPTPEVLVEQIREAGLVEVEAQRLIPGEPYFGFTARRANLQRAAVVS